MSDLMTLKDIAELNHCSMRHARDVLVKLPGFPTEAPTSTPRRRTWGAVQVRNFLHRRPLDTPGEYDLYRHFDADGVLLYVGVSLSTVARLKDHNRTSEWSSRIARVEIQRFSSRDASLDAERQAIRSEKPLYNIRHAKAAR